MCEEEAPCERRMSRFWTALRSWSSRGASASSCCCCLAGGMPASGDMGALPEDVEAIAGGGIEGERRRASVAARGFGREFDAANKS